MRVIWYTDNVTARGFLDPGAELVRTVLRSTPSRMFSEKVTMEIEPPVGVNFDPMKSPEEMDRLNAQFGYKVGFAEVERGNT